MLVIYACNTCSGSTYSTFVSLKIVSDILLPDHLNVQNERPPWNPSCFSPLLLLRFQVIEFHIAATLDGPAGPLYANRGQDGYHIQWHGWESSIPTSVLKQGQHFKSSFNPRTRLSTIARIRFPHKTNRKIYILNRKEVLNLLGKIYVYISVIFLARFSLKVKLNHIKQFIFFCLFVFPINFWISWTVLINLTEKKKF